MKWEIDCGGVVLIAETEKDKQILRSLHGVLLATPEPTPECDYCCAETELREDESGEFCLVFYNPR